MPQATKLMSSSTGMFPKPVHVIERQRLQAVPGSREPCTLDQLGWAFRPYVSEVDVRLREVSLILCNDKDTSYGAPDVLQANIENLSFHHLVAKK